MTKAAGEPRVVAELGRPETEEETRARRAENSRKHRANQTLINLALALAASLAIVLFLVLVVVRPDGAKPAAVDFRSHAAALSSTAGTPLAAPNVNWTANGDRLTTGTDGVKAWSIGFVTPSTQYIAIVQGIGANRTWVSNQIQNLPSTGVTTIAGRIWNVYDQRKASDTGNFAYALSTTLGRDSIVLHGTASNAEFRTLAAAVDAQLTGAP